MSEISATVSATAWVADTSRTVGIISATIRFVSRELWRVLLLKKAEGDPAAGQLTSEVLRTL